MLPDPNDPSNSLPMQQAQSGMPYPPVPPPYQGQPGEPTYQRQFEVPVNYLQPADQHMAVPPGAVERATQDKKQTRKYSIAKLMDYLQWLLAALEMLFLLRFILKLIGADPTNPFDVFIYNLTGFFLSPFEGIVPSTKLGTQYAFIEWSTLIGMAVYALLFYLVKLLLHTMISKPEERVEY